ncbi:MAG TPA: DUF4423 domain-containing protein [Polyangiaceae bacterium LLY-WYZ-15_(1-7)]|nr:DUF4423 domain-containing protein [Myxococcales bacterium]MAT24463.1 DUF4423 domain-containing protein [Sandaracinus sp.]HJL01999.1 DUF4423 domain-containing protein [Polyangiaceae bacterium LLY-WYZ-15_(1-7)]HJL13148.1 DUF4423 domain-containing protein [Polyangiaceae bacterium LLY-WYZ-15_(1-7)]HJL33692.1 DUF4423 domain-containing protein [Polyangiaceae bacterium LLY-WYZ-15_(1-7)]
MDALDTARLGPQLVRALRGRRSQPALSRRLGYGSNVVYMWESGRRDPAGSELFRIVARTGGDPKAAWARFPVDLAEVDLRTPEGVAALIEQLRGAARVVDVAERCGVSRYVASRWLRGRTEPRLSQLLLLIEALTFRLLDFVAALVPPDAVPMLRAPWRELEARRRVAFTHPWSQALLRLIETEDYRALERARPGWIARRLGIRREDEEACLEALQQAGLVRWTGRRWEGEPVAVDTSMASDEERRALKLHWADLGRARIERGAEGYYSWSVFALSREDYERLRAMHVRYMKALRQLVDASAPSEVVAVVNAQLFALEEG